MSNLRFDNFYITAEFKRIDWKRNELNKTSLLPLTFKEGTKYIENTSFKMFYRERVMVLKSALLLFISSVHLCAILFADFSLFWLLNVIQYYEHEKILIQKNDGKF